MKRLTALFLCLCLLLCAGCAEEAAEPEPGWEEYQQSQQEEPDTTIEEDTLQLPQVFTLAYHKDHTLDPISCGEGIQQSVAELLYEPLVQLDNAFEPQPLLCENWQSDGSSLVWTLQMRSGVLFSDGSELTAADAAASLQRAAASEKYGYRLRQVVSMTHNKHNQVIITLSQPNSSFPSLLNIPVVKRGTESQSVPVGTGAYVFVNGAEGSFLQANPDWWQGKDLPVPTIALLHAKDLDTAVYLFSSRRISLLCVDPTGDQISASGQVSETEMATAAMQFIGFNTRSGVFADPVARQVFSRSLQRDMLVDAFFSGHGVAASFPLSPLSPLYPADLEEADTHGEMLTQLAELGYSSGAQTTLTLLVNEENPFRVAAAGYIADSMSLGDWQITVKALPWTDYMAALETGDFDLYYGEVRMTGDWDPTPLLATGGSLNYGGFSDVATDSLMQTMASAPTRDNVARLLCSGLLQTAPIAPICFRSSVILTHPGVVENITTTPGSLFGSFSDWIIHLA